MQMAQADEVLVSASLYESVQPLLPAQRVQSRGDVALRGKSGTLKVYSIRL
jgi:class 3 adenylate cyclase